MGGHPSLAVAYRVEDREKKIEPAALECRRSKPRRRSGSRRAGQALLEPPDGGEAQVESVIADEDIGERGGVALQPDAMRPIDVGDDEVAPVRKRSIGDNAGPSVRRQRGGISNG